MRSMSNVQPAMPGAIMQAGTRRKGMNSKTAPREVEPLAEHLLDLSASALPQKRNPRLLNQAIAELA